MVSVKLAIKKSTPDGIIDTYCTPCDARLTSRESYKTRLFAIHKLNWRLIQPKLQNVVPNVDDSNFYSSACEKKLVLPCSFNEITCYIPIDTQEDQLGARY
ncbi:hypothetical protein HMPREF1544_12276 [Mucor circinelloides 1006PhL]|uniref:Uncharacterized protein n=1 Tax=Mucor circinelloides f. circinelloides (strain 1006PhL) TaxID=1220926 RepID=S2IUR4_MUCC1|nr:hypothetical protein HMPREF1544_12276 [Mucor circinelloides 1006PhL]